MATEPLRTQHFSIYEGGKKLGTMETADYDLQGNDEQHFTDGGGVFSDGTPSSTITANTIVVTDGQTARLKKALRDKKDLKIQVGVVDGEVDALNMRCSQAKYSTEVKSGVLKGSFTFIGFEPEST